MRKIFLLLVSIFSLGCWNKKNDIDLVYRFVAFKNRFRYFFLVEQQWKEAVFKNNAFYNLQDKKLIKNLKNYIIAYRDGTMAHSSSEFEFYPDEVSSLETLEQNDILFRKEELMTGNQLCEISFTQSPIFIDSSNYFETIIKNVSSQKFRVLKFGGFTKLNDTTFILSNFTKDFFSDSDFQNWYMDGTETWIHSGESVSDPINYGGERNNWAYQIKTEDGRIYWAGKIN